MDKNSYHFGGIEDWIADAIHSGMSADTINDKINATSSYNDGWTQQYYKDKLKARGITTTKINIEVPDHPDYTELDD